MDKEAIQDSQNVKVVVVAVSEEKKHAVKSATSTAAVAGVPPDGGLRAWLVCVTSFWINGALFGAINNAGVFYVFLDETYPNQDSFKLSLVGSLCIGATFLLSPVSAILTDIFGIRKISFAGAVLVLIGIILSTFSTSLEYLYLTYGLIFGAGASLAYTPSLVILGHYFKRRLSLVNGIVAAGSSVSTMCLPYLLTYTYGQLGLQKTYLLLAIVMAPLLLSLFIFKPILNVSIQEKNTRTSKSFCSNLNLDCSLWRNKKYLVWAISFPVCLFGYFVPYVHLVKHTNNILPEYPANILIMIMGGTSGLGRLIFGFVADVPGISRILLQQISFLSIGVLTMLISLANAFWILVVIVIGMGIFDGCFITLLGPIAFDIVGTKKASQAIGFLLGMCSVPLTLGPPIAGWMYDRLDRNYKLAFLAAGIPPIVGALLMFCIRLVQQPPQEVPAVNDCQELDCMLKSSETKESKINDSDEEENKFVDNQAKEAVKLA